MQAWTTGYVLPKQLVDILYSTVEDTEDSEGEDDSDVDDNDSGDKKNKIFMGFNHRAGIRGALSAPRLYSICLVLNYRQLRS